MKIYDDLVWRGLIQEISSPELIEKLNNGGMTFYIGTDPTADSMHIGHYSSFLISKRLKQAGHHPLLLVGGATGLIGDPKPDAERPMITYEEVEHNFEGLKNQAEKIFGFEVVNNYDWTKDINTIDFLRDYGKYFNVNYMLNKDIIKRRVDEGITYAEFSYMIIQALDFLHLYETRNCTLQVAGSDQWGNITAGIELTRKKTGNEIYGFTMPLVTKADGTKFGKSEGKAIWLDRNKTSPYEMYQFFINSEDSKVIDYLKKLTFLSKEEIDKLEESNIKEPHLRIAHKKLAEEVITFLHGHEAYEEAVMMADILFNNDIKKLTVKQIEDVFNDLDKIYVKNNDLLLDILVNNNILSSKREAREFLSNGAITVNGVKVLEFNKTLSEEDFIGNKYIVIRKGKKNYYLLEKTL